MKNARNLGLRLDKPTADKLEAFENATKIEGVTLARAALEAALESFAASGRIAFPLKISFGQEPMKNVDPLPAYLREEPATGYKAGKKKREA